MTVGVKIVTVSAAAGTVTITAACNGYTPKGAIFFGCNGGNYSASSDATRFFGAADANGNQWACADWVAHGQFGFAYWFALGGSIPHTLGRISVTNACAILIGASGTGATETGVVAAKGVLGSFITNGVTLTWTGATTVLNCILFFGPQWEVTAGVTSARPLVSPTPPFYQFTNLGYQPDLVLLAGIESTMNAGNAGTISFPTFSPFHLGWATFPEPKYSTPGSTGVNQGGAPGTAGLGLGSSTTYGQQAMSAYETTNNTARLNSPAFNRAVFNSLPGEVYGCFVTRFSNGFGLTSSIVNTLLPYEWGFFAAKWTSGRIVSGGILPVGGLTGNQSYFKWGGSYQGGTVDTDTSLHATPSFVFMVPNYAEGATFGTDLAYTLTESVSYVAFDAVKIAGFARGGYPVNGASTVQWVEKSVSFDGSSNIPLLGWTATPDVVTEFHPVSFDADGITLNYTVAPTNNAMDWPYFAFCNDIGLVPDQIYDAGGWPEAPDVMGNTSVEAAGFTGVAATQMTEAPDYMPDRDEMVVMINEVLAVGMQEAPDTMVTGATNLQVGFGDDGEIFYVQWANVRFQVPAQLGFSIPVAANFTVPGEGAFVVATPENTFVRPPDLTSEEDFVAEARARRVPRVAR